MAPAVSPRLAARKPPCTSREFLVAGCQLPLQRRFVRGLRGQRFEILERILHEHLACREWSRADPAIAPCTSNMKTFASLRTSSKCRCARCRSSHAISACHIVVKMPPTSVTTISAAAAMPALCRPANLPSLIEVTRRACRDREAFARDGGCRLRASRPRNSGCAGSFSSAISTMLSRSPAKLRDRSRVISAVVELLRGHDAGRQPPRAGRSARRARTRSRRVTSIRQHAA